MLDDEFLKSLHHVLFEVCLFFFCLFFGLGVDHFPFRKIHVEEGKMICPNCKHEYPIMSGIPNMVCL